MGSLGQVIPKTKARLSALRKSLLLVPISYLLLAGALTGLLIPLDLLVGGSSVSRLTSVELARDLLPAIGAATLTLAGFVLTIATLSIQFAATTYAPRLVEDLRRDRVLQHTLGVALGTFAYSFLVLLAVRPSHEAAAAVAVAFSLAGAAVTVLLFIALLDRLTALLRPGQTMRRITRRAIELIPHVYRDERGETEPPSQRGDGLPDEAILDWDDLPAGSPVWREAGFGLIVDAQFSELASMAVEHDAVIEMTLPVGAFLQQREVIAVIRPAAGNGGAQGDLAELEEATRASLEVDCERTVDADPAYPLRLLVDIGLRALSPGVNDPTTAVQAVAHLEQILVEVAKRRLGPQEVCIDGQVRVIVPAPSWEALVQLAFRELLSSANDPQARSALERALAHLEARVPEGRRPALAALREAEFG